MDLEKVVTTIADEIPIFRDPDATSEQIETFGWFRFLFVDRNKYRPGSDWMPIDGKETTLRYQGKVLVPNGWIRREQVAFFSDYRKVTGCWPIQEVIFHEGDRCGFLGYWTFHPNGQTIFQLLEGPNEEGELDEFLVAEGHVYLVGNVFMFIPHKRDHHSILFTAYRSTENHLYPITHFWLKPNHKAMTLFTEKDLRNCQSNQVIQEQVPLTLEMSLTINWMLFARYFGNYSIPDF